MKKGSRERRKEGELGEEGRKKKKKKKSSSSSSSRRWDGMRRKLKDVKAVCGRQ